MQIPAFAADILHQQQQPPVLRSINDYMEDDEEVGTKTGMLCPRCEAAYWETDEQTHCLNRQCNHARFFDERPLPRKVTKDKGGLQMAYAEQQGIQQVWNPVTRTNELVTDPRFDEQAARAQAQQDARDGTFVPDDDDLDDLDDFESMIGSSPASSGARARARPRVRRVQRVLKTEEEAEAAVLAEPKLKKLKKGEAPKMMCADKKGGQKRKRVPVDDFMRNWVRITREREGLSETLGPDAGPRECGQFLATCWVLDGSPLGGKAHHKACKAGAVKIGNTNRNLYPCQKPGAKACVGSCNYDGTWKTVAKQLEEMMASCPEHLGTKSALFAKGARNRAHQACVPLAKADLMRSRTSGWYDANANKERLLRKRTGDWMRAYDSARYEFFTKEGDADSDEDDEAYNEDAAYMAALMGGDENAFGIEEGDDTLVEVVP